MSNKSLYAWTFTGMMALVAHFTDDSWVTLFMLFVIGYAVMKLLPADLSFLQEKKWYCLAQLLGIYLILGQTIPYTAAYWPGKKAEIVIPVTLYLLSVYGCEKRPSRVVSILLWMMGLLCLPLLLAGGKTLKTEWIKPIGMDLSVWVIPAILLPVMVNEATGIQLKRSWYLAAAVTGLGIWIIASGVLSGKVIKAVETPLRMMSLSLALGPYSRLESICSILITFAWYGFISLCLHCANQFWVKLGIRSKRVKWMHILFLVGYLWIGVRIAPEITLGYVLSVWSVIPFIEQEKSLKI